MDPVTADDVLTVQFTHIKKGGYAQQEVAAMRRCCSMAR